MPFAPLRYAAYGDAEKHPNVVVDGSPNPSTVLLLTHWPGYPAPEGYADDLSAQIAFKYLEKGESLHDPAEIVTNNHFDQDGLVSVFALAQPDLALPRRAFLEDVAAAGDFATYRDRQAARLSMVLWAYADPQRSPLAPFPADYGATADLLYTEVLGRLPEMMDGLDRYRAMWEDEDGDLTRSEGALATGAITIEEHPRVDLAVVTVGDEVGDLSGHRFGGGMRFHGIHPMALHNATDRFAVLVVRGQNYQFTYRYETWVQYQTRQARPRVDLGPLADELTALEPGDVGWRADPVGGLTPQLGTIGGVDSSLRPAEVVELVVGHLQTAPPAWDPYANVAFSE